MMNSTDKDIGLCLLQNDVGETQSSINKMYLWNPSSVGDTVILGNPLDRHIKISFSERSLRLAHKHLLQKNKSFIQGFLLGSIEFDEDGADVFINLDRFDPGKSTECFSSPCITFPNDVVVPFILAKSDCIPKNSSICTKQHFHTAFKMLKGSVHQQGSIDLSRILAISMQCTCKDDLSIDDASFRLQFYWNAVFISSYLYVTPVKNVPIIPTALAKTLANSLDFIQEDTIRSGIMTMDKTRKLLLMLDSDPKLASVSAVGIWISYMPNIYHPAIWIACLRFLVSQSLYKKIFSENDEFLLMVYMIPNSQPSFYKVSAKEFQQLEFDVVTAEHYLTLKRNGYQSNQSATVTLNYSQPTDNTERIDFNNALDEYFKDQHQFNNLETAPRKTNSNLKNISLDEQKKDIPGATLSSFKTKLSNEMSNSNKETNYDNSRCPGDTFAPPIPQPISKSMPMSPTILEPSLIINESTDLTNGSSVSNNQMNNASKKFPIYTYHQEVDDNLVPSFYEENNVLALSTSNQPLKKSSRQVPLTNSEPSTSNLQSDRKIFSNLTARNKVLQNTQCSNTAPNVSYKLQSWFQSLSPDAIQFCNDLQKQVKELTEKINTLQKIQNESFKESNFSPSTDKISVAIQVSLDEIYEKSYQTVGVNTDFHSSYDNPISSCLSETSGKIAGNIEENNFLKEEINSDCSNQNIDPASKVPATSTESPLESLTHASANTTAKDDTEFSSIHLSSSALNNSNNEPSIASSLKAVDLPGLDTTAENSTPVSHDILSQNSPVLGESASMYLRNKRHKSKNKHKLSTDDDDDDQDFFENLLKQVKQLLGKEDANGPVEKDPDYVESPSKLRSLSTSLVPKLTRLGVLANRPAFGMYDVSTLLGNNHDLSIHANAIAMKYLTDDQLANIAVNSGDETIGQTISDPKQTIIEGRYSGLSLLSPANMSLATKKYMQKYGLVELDDDDEDKENVFPADLNQYKVYGDQPKRENVKKLPEVKISTNKNNRDPDCFEAENHPKASIRSRNTSPSKNSDDDEPTTSNELSTPGWSKLKDNLGETFDMLLPFLSDLERNLQSNPTRKDDQVDMKNMKILEKDIDKNVCDTVEQVLSPRILKTLERANKKLELKRREKQSQSDVEKEKPSSSNGNKPSIKKKFNSQENRTSQSDVSLMPPPSVTKAKSVDRNSTRERACSVDRILREKHLIPAHTTHRRMLSSPTRLQKRSKRHRSSKKKDSFERVLDSQIMQAFNRDQDTIADSTAESCEMHERLPSEAEHDENILNLTKIKSLPKLS